MAKSNIFWTLGLVIRWFFKALCSQTACYASTRTQIQKYTRKRSNTGKQLICGDTWIQGRYGKNKGGGSDKVYSQWNTIYCGLVIKKQKEKLWDAGLAVAWEGRNPLWPPMVYRSSRKKVEDKLKGRITGWAKRWESKSKETLTFQEWTRIVPQLGTEGEGNSRSSDASWTSESEKIKKEEKYLWHSFTVWQSISRPLWGHWLVRQLWSLIPF